MSCKTCGATYKCGCGTKSLTTYKCPTGDCEGEPCAQVYDAACVAWMGDDLPILDIKKGDRVSEILQKLILQAFNPGCIDSDADCQSVLNFKSTLIAKTSIQLAWDAFDSATSYRVEYKLATASTWTLNPAVTTNTDTIGNLTADTEYHIRVATICGSDTCYSLTIAVKTSA